MTLGSPLVRPGFAGVWGSSANLCDLIGVPRAFGGHFGLSVGSDQFFESVAIQRLASSSVAKFPTCETGAYPVLTATVQRPSLIIFE
jgi:hypothetical protein